jgi:hypothetical protein
MTGDETNSHKRHSLLTFSCMLGNGFRLAKYEHMNLRLGSSESSQIAPWLTGFVASMGHNEASRLLKYVGILEPLPHPGGEIEITSLAKAEIEATTNRVGDVVQANTHGYGYWYWAEISAVLSHGYYNVVYLEDCSVEIAIHATRLRRNGTADDSEDYDLDLEKLAMETS